MLNQAKYLELLRSETPENTLLVLQLLQSQEQYSLEQSLCWVLKYHIDIFGTPSHSGSGMLVDFGKFQLDIDSRELWMEEKPMADFQSHFETSIKLTQDDKTLFYDSTYVVVEYSWDFPTALLEELNTRAIAEMVKWLGK